MPNMPGKTKRPWVPEKSNQGKDNVWSNNPDPFYTSKRWRTIRKIKLKNNPLCECEACHKLGRKLPANVVDHIIPRRERPDLELSYNNLQSMNASCHNRKSAKEGNKIKNNTK